MKRIVAWFIATWLSSAVHARADVGPPPRDDCNLLKPGSPCWVDGKRRGACVKRDPSGTVVCAAGVTPTRAIASAKPAPSAAPNNEHPPVPWCAAGPPGRAGEAPLPWVGVVVALAWFVVRRSAHRRSSKPPFARDAGDRRVYALAMRTLDER